MVTNDFSQNPWILNMIMTFILNPLFIITLLPRVMGDSVIMKRGLSMGALCKVTLSRSNSQLTAKAKWPKDD